MENLKVLKKPFPHVTVENFYDEQEQELIWQELDFLCHPLKLDNPEDYLAARSESGEYLTNAKAIFLDILYRDRKYSNILTVNRKLFTGGLLTLLSQLDQSLVGVPLVNQDFTKLRYYQDGEGYLPHTDLTHTFVSFSYFYREPKKFTGGELFFPDHDYEFSCKNNSMILIPGYIAHGVNPVNISEKPYEGFSRFCITQFGSFTYTSE
jgi:Rps23 Pro-64 3,4-dihydroxylase Tpa1-like proline 4-hydroxylase